MRLRFRKQNQQGTTLVDVIIAVAIIAIMCMGLVGSLSYGFYTMGNARENQRATQVLLETLESIRLYNWDQIHSNNFIPATFTNVYDPQGAAGQQGLVYYGTISTNGVNLGSTVKDSLVAMTVSLRWTNRNIPHYRAVTTYIAKDGIQNYVY
jgi:uncharacterized protein (TIGR02598 family)